jgi:hypothetical protein
VARLAYKRKSDGVKARLVLPLLLAAVGSTFGSLAACSDDPGSNANSDGGAQDGGARLDASQVDAEEGFDGATTPLCITGGTTVPGSDTWRDESDSTKVAQQGGGTCARTFELTTTAAQRDARPKTRTVREVEGFPSLQTGHVMFNALYALALEEVRESQVNQIRDGAFNQGNAMPCEAGGCFETGKLWTYVWTRDTAYAVHLGLAALDPLRARTSLAFKTSTRRDDDALQIVQDTGSGGSYPISTDRVVWALGAYETLKFLEGDARVAFLERAYQAIKNTAAQDRALVFDDKDGLYRGEQSFLDWREQTYPAWAETVHVGMSKSLSTNVLHLLMFRFGAELAKEKGDGATEAKLREQATQLQTALRTLWVAENKMYSTYITTTLDPAPAKRWDLLGAALAILADVATPTEARDMLSSYPHLAKGAPVIWPQQQGTPIYHNRALWPFVTAYWLKAAKKARHDTAATLAVNSLVRGAAMNLSNMENFEMVTGKPWLDDGAASGPVVNSPRQLWSVAGYVSMVHDVLFGIEATQTGLRFDPYLPKKLRKQLFGESDTLVLNNYPYRGKFVSVVVRVPRGDADTGAYKVARVKLNGRTLGDGSAPFDALASRNTVEIEMADEAEAAAPLNLVANTSDFRNLYAPRTPSVGVSLGANINLAFDLAGEVPSDVTITVYRDGRVLAKDLPGSTASYTDASAGASSASHCYTIETRFASGNTSQRANPQCFWGAGQVRITERSASDFTAVGGQWVTDHGRSFYQAWGDPGHTLTLPSFTAQRTGEHLIQLAYANGAGSVNTGITCAVKRVSVEDTSNGAVAGHGYAMMPQRAAWDNWGESSWVRVNLVAGKTYRVVISGDRTAMNMSELRHFSAYTGGTGGQTGAFSRVNISGLKIFSRVP